MQAASLEPFRLRRFRPKCMHQRTRSDQLEIHWAPKPVWKTGMQKFLVDSGNFAVHSLRNEVFPVEILE